MSRPVWVLSIGTDHEGQAVASVWSSQRAATIQDGAVADLLAEVDRLRGELDRRNAFDALRAFDEAHPELSDD